MPRRTPHVLSARVDTETRARLYAAATRQKTTISKLVAAAAYAVAGEDFESAARILARSGGDPASIVEEIASLLDIELETLTPEAIHAAIDDLIAATLPPPAAEAGAAQENADAPPPKQRLNRTVRRLNARPTAPRRVSSARK